MSKIFSTAGFYCSPIPLRQFCYFEQLRPKTILVDSRIKDHKKQPPILFLRYLFGKQYNQMDQENITADTGGTRICSNDFIAVKGGLVNLSQEEKKSIYPQLVYFIGNRQLATLSLRYPLEKKLNRILKRGIDLFFSTIFITGILPWLIPLIAIAIKIDSNGPVFFLQKRNNRNGGVFTCFKFRTMFVNSQADFQPAVAGDIRITRLGIFLRKHYLDELPQLLNVWWGHMSLIGPRPHMIYDNQRYEDLIEYYDHRHKVKPGITGLAQVLGYVGETTNMHFMRNRVHLDLIYVWNWSFYLDLKIMFKTIFRFFKP